MIRILIDGTRLGGVVGDVGGRCDVLVDGDV